MKTPHRRLVTALLISTTLGALLPAQAQEEKVGLATIFRSPKSGILGAPAQTPDPRHRTAGMQRLAAPTNQWYSSVLFFDKPEPIHAHPATYKPSANGFEIGFPKEKMEKLGLRQDVVYPHEPAISLIPTAFATPASRLAGRGDFSVQLDLGTVDGAPALHATLVHGSPFSYYTLDAGDLRIRAAPNARRCTANLPAHTLCLNSLGRDFALFFPEDTRINQDPEGHFLAQFGTSGRYFSVALLPDNSPETISGFARHAFAFVTDSRVSWRYDQDLSQVHAAYEVSTTAKDGRQSVALIGLYPHHWMRLPVKPAPVASYKTIRGTVNAIASNRFSTQTPWQGILPMWAGLRDKDHKEQVASVMVGDEARAGSIFTRQLGQGTYWYGKALSATAQLMNVAEQEGNLRLRDKLLERLKERMQMWFEGKGSSYFVQDARIGSLVGYPDEYGSVKAMNDHHFHYGYWINAAAQIALRDPVWSQPGHWGGIVERIILDIANTDRRREDFPFLRNFDVYEGHSWASGDAGFAEGNNQESSSEAINAWAGLILYGEATGNKALRDLGIWLYVTEVDAINTYWLDVEARLFPSSYGRVLAAMVFGGRYAYNTWWTEEPRQIQGINLLPITPASVYLGARPDYVKRYFADLETQSKAYRASGKTDGTPADVWQDILSSYMALSDPDAALLYYKPRGDSELGDTRTRTRHWLLSLKEMGPPDFTVTANTALYGVFRTREGKRTYLAYNAGRDPLDVTFSDGKVLKVPPRSLSRD